MTDFDTTGFGVPNIGSFDSYQFCVVCVDKNEMIKAALTSKAEEWFGRNGSFRCGNLPDAMIFYVDERWITELSALVKDTTAQLLMLEDLVRLIEAGRQEGHNGDDTQSNARDFPSILKSAGKAERELRDFLGAPQSQPWELQHRLADNIRDGIPIPIQKV